MRLIVNGIIHVLIPDGELSSAFWHRMFGYGYADIIRCILYKTCSSNISSLLSIYTHIVVYYSAVRQPLYVYSSSSAKTY